MAMKKTRLMAILNLTPDSCYDQGAWFGRTQAMKRVEAILQEGADWIDIGGESTRPGASPVSLEEEKNRIFPFLYELKERTSLPLSIDTTKPEIAALAVKAGVSMINDVSGLRDPKMVKVAADSGVLVCVMHMEGSPMTMQNNPDYPKGIIPFLIEWFEKRIGLLLQNGIQAKNIVIDPGIGFGKTVAHNLQILQNLDKMKGIGFPVLLGLSRKSFLGKILHRSYPELLPATITVNTLAVRSEIDYIRVHDVQEHRDMIDLLSFYKSSLDELK